MLLRVLARRMLPSGTATAVPFSGGAATQTASSVSLSGPPGRGASRSLQGLALAATIALCASGALLGAGAAQAATGFGVTATVTAGSYWTPSAVAVDSSAGTVYVAGSGEVAVIGNNTPPKVNGFINPGAPDPDAIAVDPSTDTVYTANAPSPLCDEPRSTLCENTVSVIAMNGPGPDPFGGTVTAEIPVGVDPVAVAVDPTTHDVYVANAGSNPGTVSVIDESGDANTGSVTATIPVGDDPDAVAVDPTTHNVYVTNSGSNTVSVINADKVVTTIVDSSIDSPDAVAVDPTTHNVYVVDTNDDGDDMASVIDESGDAHTGAVTGRIDVGGFVNGVAVDPSNHNVYFASESPYGDQPDFVAIYNEAGTLIATVQDGTVDPPAAVAIDPNSNAYVTHLAGNSVSVISPEVSPTITGTPSATIVAGTGYGYQFTITGSPTPTLTPSNLPPGLTLTSGGLLSGTPTTPGTYHVTVTASNALPPAVSDTFIMTIAPLPPTIGNYNPSVAYTGTSYDGIVTATGIPAPTVTATFTPPAKPIPGLTLASDGRLTGTPTTPGSYPVTVTAITNNVGSATGTVYLTVKKGPPPTVPHPPPPPPCHPICV